MKKTTTWRPDTCGCELPITTGIEQTTMRMCGCIRPVKRILMVIP